MSVRIQLRGPDNTRHILTIDEKTTLSELLSHAARLYQGTITRPELLAGFPPAPLTDPSPSGGSVLASLSPPIKSGSALVVQEATNAPPQALEGGGWTLPPVLTAQALAPAAGGAGSGGRGAMVRICMPSDNSCLFHSLRFLIKGEQPNHISPQIARSDVAEAVAPASSPYTDAVLGLPKQQYLRELRSPNTWGGALECVVLADLYRFEIVILDYFALAEHIIGAGKGYPRRVYVLYRDAGEGAHYDALAFAPSGGSPLEDKWRNAHSDALPESAPPSLLATPVSAVVSPAAAATAGAGLQLSFSPSDAIAAGAARAVAEALHRSAAEQGRCKRVEGWRQGQARGLRLGQGQEHGGVSVVGGVVVSNKGQGQVQEHVIPSSSAAAPAAPAAPAAAAATAAATAASPAAPAAAAATVMDEDDGDDDGAAVPSTTTAAASAGAVKRPRAPAAGASTAAGAATGATGAAAVASPHDRDDLWVCSQCTFANLPLVPQCGMCAATNPVYLHALEQEDLPGGGATGTGTSTSSSSSNGNGSNGGGNGGGQGNGWVDGVRPADQTRRMRLMDDLDSSASSRTRAPAPAPVSRPPAPVTRTVRAATRGYECPVCTLWNERGATACEVCEAPPPAEVMGDIPQQPASSSTSASASTSAAAAAAGGRGRRLGDDDDGSRAGDYTSYGYDGPLGAQQQGQGQGQQGRRPNPSDIWVCERCGEEQAANLALCRACGHRNEECIRRQAESGCSVQ